MPRCDEGCEDWDRCSCLRCPCEGCVCAGDEPQPHRKTVAAGLSFLLLFVVGCGGGVERPQTTYRDIVNECVQLHGGIKSAKSERTGSNSRTHTVTCQDGSVIKATEGE